MFNFIVIVEMDLVFNYISKDGALILSDPKGDAVCALAIKSTVQHRPKSVELEGRTFSIPDMIPDLSLDGYQSHNRMWQDRLQLFRQLGHYRNTPIQLSCSSIGDTARVVGISPFSDKLVVSKLLFQELADQKANLQIGRDDKDSRIFLEITIDNPHNGQIMPPLIVLEAVEGSQSMSFTNRPVDFDRQPTGNNFSRYKRDICTFRYVADKPGEYSFIYSVLVPGWLYPLIQGRPFRQRFERGQRIRVIPNLKTISFRFIDKIPYAGETRVYVNSPDSIKYNYDPNMQQMIGDQMMHNTSGPIFCQPSINVPTFEREWMCGKCQFHNKSGFNCEMCSGSIRQSGLIKCQSCDYDDPIWVPVRPDLEVFLCELCGGLETFASLFEIVHPDMDDSPGSTTLSGQGSTDSEPDDNSDFDSARLFSERDLSCFCLGMEFPGSQFTVTVGSTVTFGEQQFEVPVAIVPPCTVQSQIDHTGVAITCAELARPYYQSQDPVASYLECEYGYYHQLLSLFELLQEKFIDGPVDLLDGSIPQQIKSLQIQLELTEQDCLTQFGITLRSVLTEYHRKLFDDYTSSCQMMQEHIDRCLTDLKQFKDLLGDLRDGNYSGPDQEYWAAPVHPRLPTVTRISFMPIYLTLSCRDSHHNTELLEKIQGRRVKLTDELKDLIGNSVEPQLGEIVTIIERFGGNPNRLKQVATVIWAKLDTLAEQSDTTLAALISQCRLISQLGQAISNPQLP